MKRIKVLGIVFSLAALICLGAPAFVGATEINFDDLSDSGYGTPIPSNYQGLNWSSYFYYINADAYLINNGPSGYSAGTWSSPNVAFNAYAQNVSVSTPVGQSMQFFGAFFTAAWNDNLQLEVKGYQGVTQIYDNTWTLSATGPTLVAVNVAGLTELDFSTSGGTQHAGYNGAGTHFAMDNFEYKMSAVPLPAGVLLLAPGLLGLIGMRKRFHA